MRGYARYFAPARQTYHIRHKRTARKIVTSQKMTARTINLFRLTFFRPCDLAECHVHIPKKDPHHSPHRETADNFVDRTHAASPVPINKPIQESYRDTPNDYPEQNE